MKIASILYALESKIFDHGGPAGRIIVSAVRSLVRLRMHVLSIDRDGDYVNAQSDAVIVSPVPHRSDYRSVRARVLDYWCIQYTPKAGDVVIDVGSGIGEDTLVFAKLVGSGGRVFSVEANPTTARCLAKTVHHSGLTWVETIQVAVSDQNGRVMISDQEAHVRNSLFEADGQHVVEVPAITLDELIETRGIQHVDLLKMNIEGAERQALLGCPRTIGRTRNVAIACHDWIAELGHSDRYRTIEFVREYLTAQGFVLQQRVDDPRPWIRETIFGSRIDQSA